MNLLVDEPFSLMLQGASGAGEALQRTVSDMLIVSLLVVVSDS
jgi:hypothetical protein